MKEILGNTLVVIGMAVIIYYVPYLIRRGWGDAENKTKKVCDTCYRDIKKWDKVLKKNGLVK